MKYFFLFLIFAHAFSVRGNGIKALDRAIIDLSSNVATLVTGYIHLKSLNHKAFQQLTVKENALKLKQYEIDKENENKKKREEKLKKYMIDIENKKNALKKKLQKRELDLEEAYLKFQENTMLWAQEKNVLEKKARELMLEKKILEEANLEEKEEHGRGLEKYQQFQNKYVDDLKKKDEELIKQAQELTEIKSILAKVNQELKEKETQVRV